MDKKQLRLILSQAEIILSKAKELDGKGYEILMKQGTVPYKYYLDKIDILIEQFNYIIPKISQVFKEENIDFSLAIIQKLEVKHEDLGGKKYGDPKVLIPADIPLLKLIFGSGNIISFLKEDILLSEDTQDKLNSLSEELTNIKSYLSEDVYNNLIKGKSEFENGGFLGSSLISGRIIKVSLDKIGGKDINEKISTLNKLVLLREKDGEQALVKANHFARNLTSHSLDIMPTASEAISYLAEAIKISKIVSEYIKKTSQQ